MARTTPELTPNLQTSAPHQREGVWPRRMIKRAESPIHGGSSVESGFEPFDHQSTARPSPRVRSPTENPEPAHGFQRGSSSPAPYMRADGLE
ncbi:hypothetical protein AVEN_138769-1 [Araneus ventricosus]|uniref:Uncharacterized protein n=1 Tax=Araneus ventricosus TaxID=182803 RepID=A0A4Y2FMJ6_ARAVE|nr:hypothetical protein AVEN_138769-1 [Araneus ventricosus]